MEQKIIESFKKNMKGEADNLDLIVSFSDEDENEVEIMERKDYGRVWVCKVTKNGNVTDIHELG